MFFAIWLFASKIPKSGQDASQNGLKLVILGSKTTIFGPSWRHVGQLSAILAPTWAILAPRRAPRGRLFRTFSQIFAPMAPDLQKATKSYEKDTKKLAKLVKNGATFD